MDLYELFISIFFSFKQLRDPKYIDYITTFLFLTSNNLFKK